MEIESIVLLALFGGLILAIFIESIVMRKIKANHPLRSVYLYRKLVKITLLIFLTITNFVLCFLPIKMRGNIIGQAVLNLIAFIYFFVDLFYLQERRREYLLVLQEKAFQKIDIFSLFYEYDFDGAKLAPLKEEEEQRVFLVDGGNKGICLGYFVKDKRHYLCPKQKMEKYELDFYARQIDLNDLSREVFLYRKDIPEEMYSRFDYFKKSRFYTFLNNFFSNGIVIFVIMLIGFAIYVTLIVLSVLKTKDADLIDWLAEKVR